MSTTRITLRPVEAEDEWMLRALFAEWLQGQLRSSALTPPEIELLIEMRFRDRAAAQSGGGDGELQQSVVLIDGVAVGYLALDRRPGETRIVDVALLAAFRGRGFGSSLLRSLQREAAGAGRLMGLRVVRDTAAQQFYRRLGFREVAADDLHVEMAWEADGGQESAAVRSSPSIPVLSKLIRSSLAR
jgi:ribosomal protein S18 acetylase RimI-like enzyme